MFFVLQVKCPLLWTDHNEIYTACGACAVSNVCVQFEVDLSNRSRDTEENVLFLPVKCPLLWTDHNEINIPCGACAEIHVCIV